MRCIYFVTLASTVLGGLCDSLQEPAKVEVQGQTQTLTQPGLPGQPGQVATQDQKPTYTGSAKPIDCLTTFNEARTAAGLPSFASAGEEFRVNTSTDQNASFFNSVCEALMTETPLTQTNSSFDRTIALAIQDGDDGDCAAAVTHFNGALSLFGDLPPAFSKDKSSVYQKLQAVSFVALYNPKESPKLDCGYFTCTKKEIQTTTTSTAKTGQAELAQKDMKLQAEDPASGTITVTTTLHGLLCATSPPALIVGQAPFEQEQYDKIKGAINSASAAVPALVTLAIAAGGFIFF